MNEQTVREAMNEAERFLRRAREYMKTPGSPWQRSVESGAVRRASMDLTRALAVMRKPG